VVDFACLSLIKIHVQKRSVAIHVISPLGRMTSLRRGGWLPLAFCPLDRPGLFVNPQGDVQIQHAEPAIGFSSFSRFHNEI